MPRGADCVWRLLLLVTFVSLALPARAQDAGSEAFTRPGYALGKLRAFPSLSVENFYNDNVFASEDGEEDDYFVSIVPGIAVESEWSRHFVSVSANGRFNRYSTITTEDNDEYAVEARGRLDLVGESTLLAIFGQGRRTVGRGDSENSERTDPQQLDFFEGELRYEHEFSRFDVGLRGSVEDLDFRDSQDDDRDRVEFGGSARLSRRLAPAFSLFLEPDLEVRDYDQTVADDGVKRSSTVLTGFVGADFDSSIVDLEFSLGPEYVGFDETSFDDLTILAVRGAATWEVTALTRLEAEVERSSIATDINGASSKVRSLASLEARHELFENLILKADASYFHEKFEELGRKDHNYRFRIGAGYSINRFFSVAAGYSYRLRNSNTANKDFRRNLLMLTVDLRL